MDNRLGHYLEQQMQTRGLSQAKLAQQAGIPRQKLNMIIRDDIITHSQMSTLVKLAQFFQVTPESLVNLCQKMPLRTSSGCKYAGDHSGFIGDVTIPDDTIMPPGALFEKTWEIQNLGQVTWQNRWLTCVDEQVGLGSLLCPKHNKVSIPHTVSKATVQISVQFTAPTVPDTYVSYWKMQDALGNLCFPQMSGLLCRIVVEE